MGSALVNGLTQHGLIDEYQLLVHPIIVGRGKHRMLMLPATPDTIASFIGEAEAAPEELSTIANVMTAPPMPFVPAEHHGKLVIFALLAYAGATAVGERAVAPFRTLATPIVDMVRPMPYPQIYPPDDPEYHPIAPRARCSSTPLIAAPWGRSSINSGPRPRRCAWHRSRARWGHGPRARRGHRVRTPRSRDHGERRRGL